MISSRFGESSLENLLIILPGMEEMEDLEETVESVVVEFLRSKVGSSMAAFIHWSCSVFLPLVSTLMAS